MPQVTQACGAQKDGELGWCEDHTSLFAIELFEPPELTEPCKVGREDQQGTGVQQLWNHASFPPSYSRDLSGGFK